jgi:hypothetical protein
MTENLPKIGFSYFSSSNYLLNSHLIEWLPVIREVGGASIIFNSGFSRAIPEDAFLIAEANELKPVVHFALELPKPKAFNQLAILFDTYANRGVEHIILGNKPNTKDAWPLSGWHDENLVDQFLDRFIPLANYAVRIGMKPVLPPLQPGGDFWDTSFTELVISGLQNRKMESLVNHLILASYGYTFGKPLSWGAGGPERWSGAKPYHTPEGQEDQLGFHNFEWIQRIVERQLAYKPPLMILDAGGSGLPLTNEKENGNLNLINSFLKLIPQPINDHVSLLASDAFDESILGCYFSLDRLKGDLKEELTPSRLHDFFGYQKKKQTTSQNMAGDRKLFAHYLLLPSHAGSVQDVVLNKVRPVIKQLKPTVGFSLAEASFAEKVTIYPDPVLFNDEQINQLRSSGCTVEILPETGIEIATKLQRT